jgi:hypothetical protein
VNRTSIFKLSALAIVLAPLPLRAQASPCNVEDERSFVRCVSAVQVAHAAQAQVGFLAAGGEPAPGIVSVGGEGGRLRASLSLRAIQLRMPDIVPPDNPQFEAPGLPPRTSIQPAVSLNAAFTLFPGAGGGMGSVELLGSVTSLQHKLVGGGNFERTSSQFAFGGGARVGLLAETAVLPRVELTASYHSAGTAAMGDACEGDEVPGTFPPIKCESSGGPSEARVEVRGWSGRLSAGHSLLGGRAGVGVGYDRWSGEAVVATRGRFGSGQTDFSVTRPDPFTVETARWSAHVHYGRNTGLGRVTGELGWLSGGERVEGWPEDAEFDPGTGSVYASLALGLPF